MNRHKVKVGMTVYLAGRPAAAGVPGKVVGVEVRFSHFRTFLVRWRGRRTPSPHSANCLRATPPAAGGEAAGAAAGGQEAAQGGVAWRTSSP